MLGGDCITHDFKKLLGGHTYLLFMELPAWVSCMLFSITKKTTVEMSPTFLPGFAGGSGFSKGERQCAG